ncbi:MAG: hypothetical protein IT437_00745 [Phycisphaerales bacterium]|nr:hypothetical protein [Phycisphaerales bacterium]
MNSGVITLLPSPRAILWVLAALVALWGVSIAWRSWRVKGRWQVGLLGLLLQPVGLLILGLSARVPGDRYMLSAYTLAGWATLYYGLLVILVGVRRDPSRGRPRCPRCWYDMSGSAGDTPRCPECGRAARSRRDLHRARPARAVVAAGAVVTLASYGVFCAERIRARPGLGLVPTVALVIAMPWLPESALTGDLRFQGYHGTLLQRFQEARAGSLTARVIHARARGIVKDANGDLALLAQGLPFLDPAADADLALEVVRALAGHAAGEAQQRRMAVAATRWTREWDYAVLAGHAAPYVPGLVRGLEDPGAIGVCTALLAQSGEAAEPSLDRLIDLLVGASSSDRYSIAEALRGIARRSVIARERLVELVQGTGDIESRAAGLYALSVEGLSDSGLTEVLLAMLLDPNDRLAWRAAEALGAQGTAGERGVRALLEQFGGSRSEPWRFLYPLRSMGESAWGQHVAVTSALGNSSRQTRAAAVSVLAWWVRHGGWDPTPAESAIRRLRLSPDQGIARSAMDALHEMGLDTRTAAASR